jgi:hypothetical protein
MRVYSSADVEHLAAQVGTDAAKLSLLDAYRKSRDELTLAAELGAPHHELALLRYKRSTARSALSRAIDPNQDVRAAEEAIERLELVREKQQRKIAKLDGHRRMIAELDLKRMDTLLEGQRWLLWLYSQNNG